MDWNLPEANNKLIMSVISGIRTDEHSSRSQVGWDRNQTAS